MRPHPRPVQQAESNLVAARLNRTENRFQKSGNWGNVGFERRCMNRKVAPIGSGMLSRTVRRGLDASAEGDFAKAFQFFQRAAASGEAEGAYRLGLLYLRGEGVVASPSDGIVWLRRAAKQGHAEAQYQLSLAYLHSGANPGIARWYHAASATHEDIAERNHALIFPNSFSVEAQPADAFRWCCATALQGLVDAQAQLGFLYAHGIGCDRDFAKARRWYALAAARGHAQAELGLGVIYENGADVAANPEVAAGWYERSAAKGNADAQIALALLYDSGRGVPSDPARAAALLEQATESGNPQAHYYFALHLLEGEGIVENRVMAETHLRKAAEQDLPEAQTALSNLCARRGGVATDFTSELRLVGAAQANAQCTRVLCVPDDAEIHRPEKPQAIESAPANELRSDYRLQLLRDSLPGSEPDIARPAGTHTTPDREIALHSGDQEWLRPHKFPGIARRIAFVALCTIAIASALIAGFSVLQGNHEAEAIITRIPSNISSRTIPGSAAGPSEAVTEIPVSKKQVVIANSSQVPKPSRSAGLASAVSGPQQRVAAGVQAKASATRSEAEASLKSEGGQLNAIEQSNHATAVSPDPAAHQPIPLIAHSTSIARREAPATARHLDTGPPGASSRWKPRERHHPTQRCSQKRRRSLRRKLQKPHTTQSRDKRTRPNRRELRRPRPHSWRRKRSGRVWKFQLSRQLRLTKPSTGSRKPAAALIMQQTSQWPLRPNIRMWPCHPPTR